MDRLMNAVRAQAQMATQERGSMRLGLVSAYDPDTYSIKVQFQPDNSETGWIPLGALSVGNGWGILAPPVLGDQVAVLMQDSDPNAGVAAWRLFNNEDVPPSVPSGEMWLLHKSGAFFKLTNDGKATFSDGHGATVVLNGDGTITSTGTWTHQGALTVQQDLTVQGSTAVKAITSNNHDISSTHKHTGVTAGSDVSGKPQ